MRTRLGAALLLFLLLAGCQKVIYTPPAPPQVPTPRPLATHPPAIGGGSSRSEPTSDQTPAAGGPITIPPTPAPALTLAPATNAPSATTVALTRPGGAPLVYVAIGASETVGVGATDPPRDGWVPQLTQLLGPETRLRNLGVSGTLLSAALQDQLPAAIQEQPDLVTVWLAVNDLNARVPLDRYGADLDTLLASLARQTSARILVGNVPDLAQMPAARGIDPVLLRAELARWNVVIAQVAGRHGAVVVDLYAGYAELGRHPEDLAEDGFHPSTAGYARVGEMFYAAARLVLPG
ncbi:MAG TPA: SGNH/GDSL hydrolase family protein [Chloroflexota bacterium]|nr:SGNH/GDSL hydrolase family protein [Chloroflexota bacterium]